MKNLNLKKTITIVTEFIISEIIFFIIQINIPTDSLKNIKMKTLIDNAIIIGTILITLFIAVQLIYWYITGINKKIKKLLVINKFNTIMLIKYEDQFNSHICQVIDNDKNLFNQDELKHLKSYLNYKNELQVEMIGKNKVFGMFLNSNDKK